MIETSLHLIVIYTERLEECRRFYTDLGLRFVAEQHGRGPQHYAAALAGGAVLELYPASAERTTGRLRLGLVVDARPGRDPGTSRETDPDGRIVELRTVAPRPLPSGTSGARGDRGRSA